MSKMCSIYIPVTYLADRDKTVQLAHAWKLRKPPFSLRSRNQKRAGSADPVVGDSRPSSGRRAFLRRLGSRVVDRGSPQPLLPPLWPKVADDGVSPVPTPHIVTVAAHKERPGTRSPTHEVGQPRIVELRSIESSDLPSITYHPSLTILGRFTQQSRHYIR